MRLFVALELPGEVRDALASWARSAPACSSADTSPDRPPLRILAAGALHVTICFLGELPADAVSPIGVALDTLAAQVRTPVVLSTRAAIGLPPRRPRVCAVRLADEEGRAAALQAAVAARLVADGWYRPERRRWLAHVTVARVSGRAAPVRGPSLFPPSLPPPSLRCAASALTLYRSSPGSRYEPLARALLPA